MALAKKATAQDAHLKVMVWGDPGEGKSRFGLSFPEPLVIDFEKGTRLYADQFDFLVATPSPEMPITKLVRGVVEEFKAGQYPGVKTIVLDPVTDYLDALEHDLIELEAQNGVKLESLAGPQKAQVYARIKDGIRKRLNVLLELPVNIVFVARAKNEWGKDDRGKMAAIGRKADANEIVDYLCDVVLHMKKGEVRVIKSRLAELPSTINAATYSDLAKAIQGAEATPVARIGALAAPSAAEQMIADLPLDAEAPTLDEQAQVAKRKAALTAAADKAKLDGKAIGAKCKELGTTPKELPLSRSLTDTVLAWMESQAIQAA